MHDIIWLINTTNKYTLHMAFAYIN